MLFKAVLTIGFTLFVVTTLVKSAPSQNNSIINKSDVNLTSNEISKLSNSTGDGLEFPLDEISGLLNEHSLTESGKGINKSTKPDHKPKPDLPENHDAAKKSPQQTAKLDVIQISSSSSSPSSGVPKNMELYEMYEQLKIKLLQPKYKSLRSKMQLEGNGLPRNTSTFSIPRNMSEQGCLKLDILMKIVITYPTTTNETYEAEFNVESSDYQGECSENMNKLIITVVDLDWNIVMEYTKHTSDDNAIMHKLSRMSLDYIVLEDLFQNVSDSFVGVRNASTPAGFSRFESKPGFSYLCDQQAVITLDENVRFVIDFYHGQPFNTKRSFDTAIICGEDDHDFSMKFPLFIGAGLIATVVIIFLIYRYFNYPSGFERLRLEPVNSRYS